MGNQQGHRDGGAERSDLTLDGGVTAANLVAHMKRAGVVVAGEEALVELLSTPGQAVDVLRETIWKAGAYGVRFTAAQGGIDEALLVEAFSSVVAPEDAVQMAKLLLANLHQPRPKQDDNLEGFRKLVRHGFVWIVAFCVALVAVIAAFTTLAKSIVVALAFYPLLTATWYYTTQDTVHGPKFRQMNRTAQVNTMFRVAGLFMSAMAFLYAVPTLF